MHSTRHGHVLAIICVKNSQFYRKIAVILTGATFVVVIIAIKAAQSHTFKHGMLAYSSGLLLAPVICCVAGS